MKNFLLISLTLLYSFIGFSQTGKEYYLLAGTYTSGKSEGIYVYKFNAANGESKYISAAKTSNPSFLAVSPNEKFVYAVNESADSTALRVTGYIAAFSFNKKNGTLTFINNKESGGIHPCYIATDKTGKWVFAGNYTSGSLAVLPVKTNGNLGEAIQIIQHKGKSITPGRQDGPHVHATVLSKDNKTLYVPDLGIDKLMIYQFNKKSGKLFAASMPFVATKPGAGPRHFVIHPNGRFAYLMEELTGTVDVFEVLNNGGLNLIQNISGLPRDFSGIIGSADIHVSPDGKFLYCSNRGESNSIGILKVDDKTGLLTWVGFQSTLGKTPRNFNFDPSGNYLLVANQNSDEIVVFKRNKESGLLTDTGKRLNIPNPVCIKWIKAN